MSSERSRSEIGNWFCEGERLYLRALSAADIPLWHVWFNSSEVSEHLNKGIFPNTEEAQADHLRNISNSRTDVQLGIVMKEGNALVGTIGIHNIDWVHRRGDISILVGEKSAWNKGVATEAIYLMVEQAFEKMNLYKVTAGMWASNQGSRICFEKNGFVLEGTLRENYFYKSKYVDGFCYGLLRREWEERKGDRKK